jgi:hypothetical protein
MPEEEEQSMNFFWFLTAALTLIFVFGNSLALMNLFSGIIHWNGILGHIVNFWDLNFAESFEKLVDPFAKWIGWRPDWISNYLVFGFFHYSLILCASKLQSKWEQGTWTSLAITWPLGVIAWPGMIAMLIRSLIEDFDQRGVRKLVFIVFSPFLTLVIMSIANFLA